MPIEPQSTQDGLLKRFIITPLLVIASLYSLYLVVHPYTPLSKLSISILDLTQVQRATHVFFLLLTGYSRTFHYSPPIILGIKKQ